MVFGINGPCSIPGDGTCGAYWSPPAIVFYSYHSGGCNFLRVDGSVTFVSENTDKIILKSLSTRAGGEVVDEF